MVIEFWFPLLLSGIAIAISLIFSWLTFSDGRHSARLSREQDLHEWVQSIAEIYLKIRTSEEAERNVVVADLSIQIDYGRLLFPNEISSRAILEYPKGLRSAVLDPLVETFSRIEKEDFDDLKLAQDWRQFTDQLTLMTTAFKVNTSPEATGKKQYRNP